MSKLLYKGAELNVTHTATGYYSEKYIVSLEKGEWPSDNDLIILLGDESMYKGDDVLPRDCTFGGVVKETPSGAKTVHVYLD